MNYRKPTFWVVVTALAVCLAVAVCFLTDPNPSREFSMSGNHVSGLDPEAIVERILDIEDWESSNVYMNSMNFSLHVDSNFNWMDSQTVSYFFSNAQKTYGAQLRIFPEEGKYFLTEPTEKQEQSRFFLLQHYLEAVKYLPQYEIMQMAPADQYIISHIDGGSPSDYQRVITYSSQGVSEIDGWNIHLLIQPLHTDGDAFSGTGNEVIHVFYSSNGISVDRSQLDQLQADKILVSRMDFPSGAKSDFTITDQNTISKLLSMYKSVEVEDYSRPINDERIMLQFFSGNNMVVDWYVSYYEEDDEIVTCGDAFGLGNKRVVGDFDYDWLLSLCIYSDIQFTGNRNLGLNAEIIDIDYDQKILYVKDIDESAAVFGDRCAIDCSYAISRNNLIYVNYDDPNDVRTIEFDDFEVGDSIIIGIYDSEKQKAFNGSAVADQIQLSTQRVISDLAFEFNFAGNMSGGQRMELTEEQPYWCITIVNGGVNGITIDVAGDIYYVDAGTTGSIYSDKAWKPGTYAVSFGSAGGNGMEGYAICRVSSVPFLEEEPLAWGLRVDPVAP